MKMVLVPACYSEVSAWRIRSMQQDDRIACLHTRPFLLAQLVGHFQAFSTHSHMPEHITDAVLDFGLVFPAGSLKDELQVGIHSTVTQELKVLEYNADATTKFRNIV